MKIWIEACVLYESKNHLFPEGNLGNSQTFRVFILTPKVPLFEFLNAHYVSHALLINFAQKPGFAY